MNIGEKVSALVASEEAVYIRVKNYEEVNEELDSITSEILCDILL